MTVDRGGDSSSSALETHQLLTQTLAHWNEAQAKQHLADLENEAMMLHRMEKSRLRRIERGAAIQKRERLQTTGKSSSSSQSDAYQSMCDDLIDQKYVLHNKGKKYSKNLKVCIKNNNRSSSNKMEEENKQQLMRMLSKERATKRKSRDVKQLKKKSRNWKSASITKEIRYEGMVGDDMYSEYY